MKVLGFLKEFMVFVSICLMVSLCLTATFFIYNNLSFKDLPAPNFSNSYSYNEKMQFLHEKRKDIEVIGIGSSMSLNNLSSETIMQKLHTGKYINASSWGMSYKDIFLLVKILDQVYPLKAVIVASNIGDAQSTDKIVKYDELTSYLKKRKTTAIAYHFKLFELNYYITNFPYAKTVRSYTNDYAYLGFDNYGAINFNRSNFNVDSNRWKQLVIHDSIRLSSYSYLDSLSNYCKQHNLRLLFFQSPIRSTAYAQFSENDLDKVRDHSMKVAAILHADNHSYITTDEGYWSDDLFIDATHLNGEGAKLFMNYCFDKLSKN